MNIEIRDLKIQAHGVSEDARKNIKKLTERKSRKLSRIYGKIARLTEARSPEGFEARCCAVNCAVAGGEIARAKKLVQGFLAEDGANPSVCEAFRNLIPKKRKFLR